MLRFFLPILLLTACTVASPSVPLQLERGEVSDEFHRSQIGHLRFFGEWIDYEDFKPAGFLSSVNIHEESELNARMFLDRTITSHLHDLSPDLTVEELCHAGSFQFTFLVDSAEVYVYNLPTGAGSCGYKNETTVYGIPLRGEKEVDHWGRFLWQKFMKLGGGEAVLAEGIHDLTVEVRPYLDQNGPITTGPVIASGSVRAVATLPDVDPQDAAVQSISPTPRFDLSDATVDPEPVREMNSKIARGQFTDITSVVVLQDGKLLIEEYFNGADRATLHDTRSVGKSFAGSILGIALRDGHLKSVGQPLSDFYTFGEVENPSPLKSGTTLRQLLTMSSPFAGNDSNLSSPGNEENMYPTRDWVAFTLGLPVRQDTSWSYFTAGTIVLGDILHRNVPGGLESYAARELFAPLGITEQVWQRTPTGIGNTAGSLRMTALSLASFGQLYRDGGRDILPTAWVEASLKDQVTRNDDKNGHYGYLFWRDTVAANGKTYSYASASGNGGNKIIILDDIDVVVVITATAYGKAYAHWQAEEILARHVLPAITKVE